MNATETDPVGDDPARCTVCGTPVTAAQSVARGMGRDCWRKTHPPTAGHPDTPIRASRPAAGPGQTALPVQESLPLLPQPPDPTDHVWRGRTIHTIPTGDAL